MFDVVNSASTLAAADRTVVNGVFACNPRLDALAAEVVGFETAKDLVEMSAILVAVVVRRIVLCVERLSALS